MMRKVIVFTLFSLLTFGGFVVGLSGLDLAEAKEKDCTVKQHPKGKTKIKRVDADFGKDVLAVFVLKADGNIQIMEGPNTDFKEPKKYGGKSMDKEPAPSRPGIPQDIPPDIQQDMQGSQQKIGEIITFVGDTCVRVNGVYYCW